MIHFHRLEDSVAQRDEEVGDSSFIFNVAIRGAFEYVLVMFDSVVEPGDLLFEAANFDVFLGVALSDGREEPFGDGSEDVGIKVGVCCQSGRNGIGRHRWFRTFERTDRERDAVLNGRGVGRIGRSI